MSLEVDRTKDGHLFAVPQEQEEKIEHNQSGHPSFNPQQNHTYDQSFHPPHAPPPFLHQVNGNSLPEHGRILRLRRTNTLLLLAAIAALVLAIVAAAVGGSLAANRQTQIMDLQSQLAHTLNRTNVLPSNETAPLGPASNCTPSNDTAPIGVVSNCTSYTSPYSASKGGQFTIHCGNDLKGGSAPDILGIYAYTLDDCITACSSYNRQSQAAVRLQQTQVRPNGTCAAVAWNRALSQSGGNCWLKPAIEVGLSINQTVDVATLNT